MQNAKSIGEIVEGARARLGRLHPAQAADRCADGAVLVDVRTTEQRTRGGWIPGAVVVSLNVLEWRADLTSPAHDPALGGEDTLLVLICQEGYSSSLAAARLLDLGRRATDVVGGFQAWCAAGLPVEPV